MLVADVMTKDVVSVHMSDRYKPAVKRMLDAGVSGMPVVDDDGTVVGMVTEADFIAKEAYGAEERRPLAVVSDMLLGHDTKWLDRAAAGNVADVMTHHVVSAESHEDVRAAARRMLEAGVKRLPVIDDGHLVGIVSRRDLLSIFRQSDNTLRQAIEATLRDPAKAPEVTELVCLVWDGEVLLEGAVLDEQDAPVVGAIVRHLPGVVKLHNNLVVEQLDRPEKEALS